MLFHCEIPWYICSSTAARFERFVNMYRICGWLEWRLRREGVRGAAECRRCPWWNETERKQRCIAALRKKNMNFTSFGIPSRFPEGSQIWCHSQNIDFYPSRIKRLSAVSHRCSIILLLETVPSTVNRTVQRVYSVYNVPPKNKNKSVTWSQKLKFSFLKWLQNDSL